jgi:16S rRNA (uracil1498-N3)-methyltransferase
LQKGTEIGVSRFVPVIARRTLVRDADVVTSERLTRWERIIAEAAEQSGRGRLPELAEPLQFAVAVGDALATTQRVLIAWEEAGSGDLTAALAELPAGARVALFVGPEGGYEAAEVDLAQSQGARSITLGPRILRTETAALVGPALVLNMLGDMSQ